MHHLAGRPGSRRSGEIRDQYHHAIDIVPTILDCLGVEPPDAHQGPRAEPLRRRQHALQLRRRLGARRPAGRSSTRCSARGGSGTTAGRPSRPTRRSAAGATSTTTTGSSTTPTSTARSCTTWPREQPEQAARAGRPVVRRGRRQPGVPARRPLGARDHHDAAPAARAAARPLRLLSRTSPTCPSSRRSTSATAPTRSARSSTSRRRAREGVLFAHGSRFGGHALYVKDNRLHYVNNFVGMFEQKVVATEDVPTGENLILSASFDKDGEDPPGVAHRHRCRCTTATGRSARAASRPSPGMFIARRRGPVRRPRQRRRRSPRTTPARPVARSPAAPSTGSPSTSAASPTSTSSARRRHAHARVARPARRLQHLQGGLHLSVGDGVLESAAKSFSFCSA